MSANGSIAKKSFDTNGHRAAGSPLLHGDYSTIGLHEAWTTARDSALAKCTPDQKLILNQIKSPGDARAALLNLESQRKSRRSATVTGKIQRVLDIVKVFEDAMKVYSNAGATELCLIWGSLTIVIQVQRTAINRDNRLTIYVDGFKSGIMFRQILGYDVVS